MSAPYRDFKLEGRELIVAKFTTASNLAEILKALPERGASLLRLSSFEVLVLWEATVREADRNLTALGAEGSPLMGPEPTEARP